jgi:transposase
MTSIPIGYSLEGGPVLREELVMTRRDLRRINAATQAVEGRASIAEAAQQMGVSYRQARRILKRYRQEGVKGIQHASLGRTSNRRIEEEVKEAILDRYQERYLGFGATLAAEKLFEEGLEVDHETLRRWLLAKGLLERRRRSRTHRSRRERKQHFGELVQLDGSHHKWFEDRGGQTCLMSMVDDATGKGLYWMEEEESSAAALKLLWMWVKTHKIPHSLYVDGLSVYGAEREPTLEEQLEGVEATGVFQRACQKLGITLILARSPQAKGRVERRHGVMQDRFVKELRLAGVNTIEAANRVMLDSFAANLDKKLAVLPVAEADFHHPVYPGLDLRKVFCWEQLHTVSNDWVVRHKNCFYQILRDNRPRPRPKDRVIVQDWLDGTRHVYFQDKELRVKDVTDLTRVRLAG